MKIKIKNKHYKDLSETSAAENCAHLQSQEPSGHVHFSDALHWHFSAEMK
jgi:hypothetical protein